MSAKARASAITFAAALLATAGPARAGGFELVQQSAVAGGTGSASTARDDDAAAAWFNPAALADGKGLRANLGVTLAFTKLYADATESAPDAPWHAETESGASTPPYLYVSYADGPWAAGFSLNLPFASRVQWPANWQHRFDIISSEPQFLRVAPFVAWSFGKLKLSAGPHWDTGRLYVKRATNHIAQEGSSALILRGSGFGFHAAAFVDVSDELAVGLSYKSRTTLSMEGEADFSVPAAFAPRFPDQRVTSEWTLPDRIAAGIAVGSDPVRVLFDLTLTMWSVNDELVIDFSEDVTDDRTQINHWRSSAAMRAGVEWSAMELLILRGGGYWDGISAPPVPDETLAPSSPDSTRLAVTLGASVMPLPYLAVDAFYEHLRLLERESASDDAPMARYGGSAHILGLGIRAHTEPLGAAQPAPTQQ